MLGAKTTNLPELAMMRVRRGVRWCENNAPHGWQRHLLDIQEGGKLSFRARPLFTSGHDSVLGLIFEHYDEFVPRGSYYVSDTPIMQHFGLTTEDCIILGFCADYDMKGIPHQRETQIQFALEEAWLQALTTYARPPHSPNFHKALQRRDIWEAARAGIARMQRVMHPANNA